MEYWKTIEGTDGKYSVSSLGRVRRNEHYTEDLQSIVDSYKVAGEK